MTAEPATEDISDEDHVSRLAFYPPMGPDLDDPLDKEIFLFMSKGDYCVSLVWRKYVPIIKCVHALGCEKERWHQKAGKNKKYIGSRTALVKDIRDYPPNINGHKFCVVHVPSEGKHHAHICVIPAPDAKIGPNDRSDFREALLRYVFTKCDHHKCSDSLFYYYICKAIKFFLEK